MEFIKNQHWRYATKKFNPNKKVSAKKIALIKQAVQLSVSSYGLQLYKVLIIENEEVRKKLKPVSWNQNQIIDASHLFVFCNYSNVNPVDIDQYITLTASVRQLDVEGLKGYGDFIKSKLAEQSTDELFYWTKHQTYIALANLLSACAELKIDTCPMEGFLPEEYNRILGLREKGLNVSVIASLGYRDDGDKTQNMPKIRKPLELLFEKI